MKWTWISGLMFGLAVPALMSASPVTHLEQNWQLQSACKLQAGGEAIAAEGFATDGWLKTTVPSTVLAVMPRGERSMR